MLVRSHQNEAQLERLEGLIEDVDSTDSSKKKNALEEAYNILNNDTLDLNRDVDEYEIPLLIKASIWHSNEMIELLLKSGADVNKTYNPFKCYGEVEPTDYSKDELVNSMDILLENRKIYFNTINDPECLDEFKEALKEDLIAIDNCIKIIVNFGGKTTKLN